MTETPCNLNDDKSTSENEVAVNLITEMNTKLDSASI